MDEYAFMLCLPAHQLLSLAIAEYWQNELEGRQKTIEAEKLKDVVYTGSITEFADFICNKADSAAIQFALQLVNNPDISDNRTIDEFPDSQWLSIQNQLKSDFIAAGW